MRLFTLTIFVLSLIIVGCATEPEEKKPTEPVQIGEKPLVPDSPGNAGETKASPT